MSSESADSGKPAIRGQASDEHPAELTSTLSIGMPSSSTPSDVDPDPGVDPDQLAAENLDPGSALLVVRKGPNAGSRFLLDIPVITAGRHHDSDIFLDDVTVSRRHAEFKSSDHGYRVKDVGSLNGTYVNRERIDELELTNGDEVQIGKYRMIFFAKAVSGAPEAGGAA